MAGTRRTAVRWVNVYLHPILHIETMLDPRELFFKLRNDVTFIRCKTRSKTFLQIFK